MYDLLLKGDKSKDIRMMPEDVIFIPVVGPQAAVIGNVRRPAIYELKGNTTVEALLAMAGGMTPTGSIDRVQMMRVKQKEFRTVFEGDLKDRSINNLKKMQLADGDLIRLFSVVERQSLVRITGPVAKPGDFAIDSGRTTLGDVLGWAGGLLYYAADEVEITRVSVTPAGPKTERLKVNARRAMQGDPVHNVALRMNDFIFARTVPDWKLYRQVTVYGEVMYPGRYSIEDGETLSSLLQRAGGFSPRAYPRAAIFTRERVKRDQQRQIEEMADRMERELLGISANELSAALTQAESNLLKAEASQKQALVAKLRETKAAGRIVTLIAQPEVLKGTAYDIPLDRGGAEPHILRIRQTIEPHPVYSYGGRVFHGCEPCPDVHPEGGRHGHAGEGLGPGRNALGEGVQRRQDGSGGAGRRHRGAGEALELPGSAPGP